MVTAPRDTSTRVMACQCPLGGVCRAGVSAPLFVFLWRLAQRRVRGGQEEEAAGNGGNSTASCARAFVELARRPDSLGPKFLMQTTQGPADTERSLHEDDPKGCLGAHATHLLNQYCTHGRSVLLRNNREIQRQQREV